MADFFAPVFRSNETRNGGCIASIESALDAYVIRRPSDLKQGSELRAREVVRKVSRGFVVVEGVVEEFV